jgi:histidine triad (HIT) family protein
MGAECLFCRIVAGSVPAKRVYEDALCLAFADINPQAPTHVLVIPREHIASTAHAEETHAALLGHLIAKAAHIARDAGLSNGYRLVINTGEDGGQTVDHLHVHVLGGRHMNWPPG